MRTPIEQRTRTFPREENGQFADNDVYIDCYNNIQIFSYGHGILKCYIPSIGRGRNILNAIEKKLDKDIVFNIEETDSEILFRFNAKHMKDLEPYLKPKTNGANISPFSSKNLPRNKSYKISDEDLDKYEVIVKNIPKNQMIAIVHTTKTFLQLQTTENNSYDDIKADMALKGLRGKEYIHSIGKWSEYINYLEEQLCRI